MRGTVVFDLDGTLETPYLEKPEDVEAVRKYVVAKYGAAMFDRMFTTVLGGMPHFSTVHSNSSGGAMTKVCKSSFSVMPCGPGMKICVRF